MLDGVSFKTQPIGFWLFYFKSKPIDVSYKNIYLVHLLSGRKDISCGKIFGQQI
jgi:hypothetical protein